MYRRVFALLIIAATLILLAVPALAQDDTIVINWWSHWANEPNKRTVIETFAADYEAAHPNVQINLEWWDKVELYQALRSTLTAGEGFPDIFTMDPTDPGADFVPAGWVLNLDPYVNWEEQVSLAGTQQYRYPNLDIEGTYGVAIEAIVDGIIFYNKAIFQELGIEVPEDYTFTFDEWKGVMQTCKDAGYAPVADAIGNRTYPGTWPFQQALMAYAGPEDYSLYLQGLKNWDTPEVRAALETHIELSAIPIWPEAFATMTIDEFHAYFNNQEAACAMYLATWYTGRAFKPPDEGGQAADFDQRLGMLRPVEYPDAEHNGLGIGLTGSGYAGAAMSEHPDVVGDILSSLATPKYGALWVGMTASPTAIIYDPADVESEYAWYFALFDEVYGDIEVPVVLTNPACGEAATAIADVTNSGIPLGLITDVDEAVSMLNEGLCEGAQ